MTAHCWELTFIVLTTCRPAGGTKSNQANNQSEKVGFDNCIFYEISRGYKSKQ